VSPGKKQETVSIADTLKKFESSDELMRLCGINELDTQLAAGLAFKLSIIPLTKQLTCLAGYLWSRTIR
jgi:DNA polymerase alpha subunit A